MMVALDVHLHWLVYDRLEGSCGLLQEVSRDTGPGEVRHNRQARHLDSVVHSDLDCWHAVRRAFYSLGMRPPAQCSLVRDYYTMVGHMIMRSTWCMQCKLS